MISQVASDSWEGMKQVVGWSRALGGEQGLLYWGSGSDLGIWLGFSRQHGSPCLAASNSSGVKKS